ncbi:hypothetical protein NHH82_13160 [Oxalobacteraceae bacterium OTU3REALA1]|nr:hypothetical protein NHH82_13160 [Oxalobacteraceae bacterium OTU3REALA1]
MAQAHAPLPILEITESLFDLHAPRVQGDDLGGANRGQGWGDGEQPRFALGRAVFFTVAASCLVTGRGFVLAFFRRFLEHDQPAWQRIATGIREAPQLTRLPLGVGI